MKQIKGMDAKDAKNSRDKNSKKTALDLFSVLRFFLRPFP